jgi:hypothetical protein
MSCIDRLVIKADRISTDAVASLHDSAHGSAEHVVGRAPARGTLADARLPGATERVGVGCHQ